MLELNTLLSLDVFAPAECIAGSYFTQLLWSAFWPWALVLVVHAIMSQLVTGVKKIEV